MTANSSMYSLGLWPSFVLYLKRRSKSNIDQEYGRCFLSYPWAIYSWGTRNWFVLWFRRLMWLWTREIQVSQKAVLSRPSPWSPKQSAHSQPANFPQTMHWRGAEKFKGKKCEKHAKNYGLFFLGDNGLMQQCIKWQDTITVGDLRESNERKLV